MGIGIIDEDDDVIFHSRAPMGAPNIALYQNHTLVLIIVLATIMMMVMMIVMMMTMMMMMGVAPFTYDPFTYHPFYLPLVGKRVGHHHHHHRHVCFISTARCSGRTIFLRNPVRPVRLSTYSF